MLEHRHGGAIFYNSSCLCAQLLCLCVCALLHAGFTDAAVNYLPAAARNNNFCYRAALVRCCFSALGAAVYMFFLAFNQPHFERAPDEVFKQKIPTPSRTLAPTHPPQHRHFPPESLRMRLKNVPAPALLLTQHLNRETPVEFKLVTLDFCNINFVLFLVIEFKYHKNQA